MLKMPIKRNVSYQSVSDIEIIQKVKDICSAYENLNFPIQFK